MLKRLVNLAGSIVVAISDWLRARVTHWLGQRTRSTCVVLAYHSVPATKRTRFAEQMNMLLRFAKPVRTDIEALPRDGGHYAAITFDDGLTNIIENALPVLRGKGIPATLFVVTEALGGNPSWEHFGGDDPSAHKVMSEEQLRHLPSDLITIGSHTMTHPVLPKIDGSQLRPELGGSRQRLKSLVGGEVNQFSFPYGVFSEAVIEGCREAGYERVFSALPIFAFAEPKEYLTGRVGVSITDWPIEFRLKLAGAYRWLPYAYDLKRKALSVIRSGEAQPLGMKSKERRSA